MARRAAGQGGEYLPQLAVGIRLRAARTAASFPDIGRRHLSQLEAGQPVPITATDTYSALAAVDLDLAVAFSRYHGGPWPWADEPAFIYDPDTATLRADDTDPSRVSAPTPRSAAAAPVYGSGTSEEEHQ